MKLTIVYDDELYFKKSGIPDHGFSCYIETDEHILLFDTGTKGENLLKNMDLLSINPNTIDIIVISHEHYDHNGGLNNILSYLDNPIIYRLEPTSLNHNFKEIIVTKPVQITKQIHTTGRLQGSPLDEQSLLLQTSKGIFVITGCSHSRIRQILSAAKRKGRVIGILGGFHDFLDLQLLSDLQYIYPCHCTKHKSEIKKTFPHTSFDCGIGLTIEFS